MDTLFQNIALLIAFGIVFSIPLLLILLANLGEKYQAARYITIGIVALIGLLLIACAPLTLLGAAFTVMDTGAPAPPMAMDPLLAAFTALVFAATGIASLLPMIPAVRRLLAHIIPIRPESIVNGVALSLSILVAGFSVASLPSAFTIAEPTAEAQLALESLNILPLVWLQNIFFVLYGFVGVGIALRRPFWDTMGRLGLGPLTWRRVSIAVGAWLGLLLMDQMVSLMWRAVSPAQFEEFGNLTDALFGSFISIPGALTIGLAAGIGEEILFRGALQPRLGIILTSLLFMIVHAQYGLTPALFQIFIVGIILGLIRKYENTTTTILVHALFNASSILLALYFPDFP